MGEIYFGINLEFVRHADKPFEWGIEKATQLGYPHVEPIVHRDRLITCAASRDVVSNQLGEAPRTLVLTCIKAAPAVST